MPLAATTAEELMTANAPVRLARKQLQEVRQELKAEVLMNNLQEVTPTAVHL